MTAQVPELLILNGEVRWMACLPPLPKGHARFCENALDREDYDYGTNLQRLYQGTWEVKLGKLYLVRLRGRYGLLEGAPILADWFSGVLRVRQGKLLCYVHSGFSSVYEEELQITVERGEVMETRVIDNRALLRDPSIFVQMSSGRAGFE